MTGYQPTLDLGLAGVPDLNVVDLRAVVSTRPSDGPISEPKGVVYTKPWVVELILDLAGYQADRDLGGLYAVEPSAGHGAFFGSMVRRLLDSLQTYGRPLSDARRAIRAYELNRSAAERVMTIAVDELSRCGVEQDAAEDVAAGWVTVGDYLLAAPTDRKADFVAGNPPYIRYDDLSGELLSRYRKLYPTMVGRCDIYIGFIEAGLRQLGDGGVLSFICADRWMRAAYGAELRRLVSGLYSTEVVIEMHDAPAFEDDVAAYPAVIVIRRAPQGTALVASAGPAAGPLTSGNLAEALTGLAAHRVEEVPGFRATHVDQWFRGTSPWPSLDPERLGLLRHLEQRFPPVEDAHTGTKVGIGVATGADRVYVTKTADIEPDRLLPLAMAADTKTGVVTWSGHYLVDPWLPGGGLVDLDEFPRLRAYLHEHRADLERRNIARRNARDWYRTIDRVSHGLTGRDKLYFPDMKLVSNPTLDRGKTYPHHNLYFLVSDRWELEVLGGLLLSRVAQLFIEAYCVKMRGGTLRFQAQYLRRIRVPDPGSLSDDLCGRLCDAFGRRDVGAATAAAIEAYDIAEWAGLLSC